MIQRIQSIWLLLAVVAAILTFKLSFYSGNMIGPDQLKVFKSLLAPSNIAILVITVAIGVIALVAVFLYKNRVLQMRLTLAALVLSLLNIVLYYNQTLRFAEGNFDLTALISLAIPVFLVLAVKGVYNDQKLVKSLDRLR
jgi:hypothetical protein